MSMKILVVLILFLSKIQIISNTKTSLTNYWAFTGSFKDQKTNHYLNESVNAFYSKDRHGNVNSSLRLRHGYLKAPIAVYFHNEFTITLWFKLNSIGNYARIIDFGNGPNSDNIFLTCCFGNSSHIGFFIFNKNNFTFVKSLSRLKLHKWTHLTFVFNKTIAKIYINGRLDAVNSNMISPRNIIRNLNYFGKSNWIADSNADSFLSQVKIFNKALSDKSISKDCDCKYKTNSIDILNLKLLL